MYIYIHIMYIHIHSYTAHWLLMEPVGRVSQSQAIVMGSAEPVFSCQHQSVVAVHSGHDRKATQSEDHCRSYEVYAGNLGRPSIESSLQLYAHNINYMRPTCTYRQPISSYPQLYASHLQLYANYLQLYAAICNLSAATCNIFTDLHIYIHIYIYIYLW